MNGVSLITQSEYARRRGVAKSAVAKAVKENRIRLIDGLVDPDVADIQWERNTRARADSAKPPAAAGAAAAAAGAAAAPGAAGRDRALLPIEAAAQQAARPAGDAPAAPPASAAQQAPDSGYFVDRARREKYEADMAEIKLREQRGELVSATAVRLEIAARVGQIRANLLQIPTRLAPLLAPETDQARCHALLDAELRAVLTDLGGAATGAASSAGAGAAQG